jgi:hypothetical protein
LKRLKASLEINKGKFEVQRCGKSFEDAFAGRNDFAANAIARDEASKMVN